MRSVLVIDDEPTILRLVRAILNGLGYETHTALDAESALALVRTVRPDLIITDVVLPGMAASLSVTSSPTRNYLRFRFS